MATLGASVPMMRAKSMAFWMMSAFSGSVGRMLIAASVISSGLGYSGTSKRKTCDRRRPVRSAGWPSTALSSSSVCRLPFISTSTSLLAAISAASWAAAWLCSMQDLHPFQAQAGFFGHAADAAFGADQHRHDQAVLCRVQAPLSEPSSQGCTTAQRTASSPSVRASSAF
jgi:hypothetical protein